MGIWLCRTVIESSVPKTSQWQAICTEAIVQVNKLLASSPAKVNLLIVYIVMILEHYAGTADRIEHRIMPFFLLQCNNTMANGKTDNANTNSAFAITFKDFVCHCHKHIC